MKKKKILACLMTIALASSIFTGCGKKDKESAQSATPKDEKPVDITWYIFGTQAQRGDVDTVLAAVNPLLQKKIGVNLILKAVDNAAYEEKMTMIINSNEYYDLCWSSSWRNKFAPNVAKGAFKEITNEMLNKNAPDIVKAYPKEYFDYGRVGGKLYGIFNVQNVSSGNINALVQTGIAKKYNFDVNTPKTFEEFTAFFEQIVKNEKGMFASKPMPVDVFKTINKVESIGEYAYYKKDDPSLKVYAFPGSDIEKQAQVFNQNWFKKGIIRQDIAAVVDDLADRNANKYAAEWQNGAVPGNDVTWSTRQKLEYKNVFLKGYENYSYTGFAAGVNTLTTISTNSKYPEKALQLINLVHTDKDVHNMLVFGVEGKHYTKVDKNIVDPIPNSGYGMQQLSFLIGNSFNNYVLKGNDPNLLEQQKAFEAKAVKSPISGFSFDSAPIANEIAQLSAVSKEYLNFEYLSSFETQNPTRLSKIKNAGIDKVVAEIQKQLDEWAKVNGKKK